MAADSQDPRPAAPRLPRAAWLGTLALIGFGAAALTGMHGGSRAFAAIPADGDVPELAPVFPPGEGEQSPSGRRRSGATDPLWDNDVWYPGADAEPPSAAPGGFRS